MNFLKVFTFVLLYSIFSFGKIDEQTLRSFNSDFRNVLVDVRGSRGGNGDVSAGYLTIMDLIKNHKTESKITVLVDSESRKILNRIAQGNSTFWESVAIHDISTLPKGINFDLYIALASPSGSFRYKQNINESGATDGEVAAEPKVKHEKAYSFGKMPVSDIYKTDDKKINMDPNGILIVQTVLGNTENSSSVNPHAVVRGKGINFDMSPAGIAENETGIYNDYVASELRDKSPQQVDEFINSQLSLIEDNFSRDAVEGIVNERTLQGSSVGLAYGITASQTQMQFESYLHGLSGKGGKSYTIITPSGFKLDLVKDEALKARIVVIDSGGVIPTLAEPGKIYVVKTKTLPHSVFVGLTARSMKKGLVPVGAGDGFLSAAIKLGGPFVMTRVAWNSKNIKNLSSRLAEASKRFYNSPGNLKRVQDALKLIYGNVDLSKAQTLKIIAPVFRALDEQIPDLTERIIQAAVRVRGLSDNATADDLKSTATRIEDKRLQASVEAGGIKEQMRSARDFSNLFSSNFDPISYDYLLKIHKKDNGFLTYYNDLFKPAKKPATPITGPSAAILKKFGKNVDGKYDLDGDFWSETELKKPPKFSDLGDYYDKKAKALGEVEDYAAKLKAAKFEFIPHEISLHPSSLAKPTSLDKPGAYLELFEKYFGIKKSSMCKEVFQ